MKRMVIAALLVAGILSILSISKYRTVTTVNVAMTEQEAIEAADKVITEHFPDLSDITGIVEGYKGTDSEDYWEVTYSSTIEVESNGSTIEIPRIVIITIDQRTRDQSVAVSD